ISGVNIAIMSLAAPMASANDGHFRPIEVLTEPGTLFEPGPPSPIFLYGWPMQHVIDLIHRALAEVWPGGVPAGSGGDVCAVTWWGEDADGEYWIDGGDHFVGQGATQSADADAPLMHVSCSGIRNMPAEVWEAKHPVLVERFEFAADSAGAGQFRGGPGVDISYRVERQTRVCISWERTKTPPWGLAGGGCGRANSIAVLDPEGQRRPYTKVTDLELAAGSVVEMRTGGGGGHGPPPLRAAQAVAEDVADGLVSEQAAARDYPHAWPPAPARPGVSPPNP
ncbi:MAG TPA: hydantoinase B/oxoprolinase family protein, partial [Solirubrobacterales bacterium]|nr:hydantoinase B/oxoprolinase family protein [Solirubrobacterales bacterium]